MGRKPRMTDGGGDYGGKIRTWSKGTCEFYYCSSCDKRQVESKQARTRNTRVRCKHCGANVYPVKEHRDRARVDLDETAEDRGYENRCEYCDSLLRSTNTSDVCALCAQRRPIGTTDALKAMGAATLKRGIKWKE